MHGHTFPREALTHAIIFIISIYLQSFIVLISLQTYWWRRNQEERLQTKNQQTQNCEMIALEQHLFIFIQLHDFRWKVLSSQHKQMYM